MVSTGSLTPGQTLREQLYRLAEKHGSVEGHRDLVGQVNRMFVVEVFQIINTENTIARDRLIHHACCRMTVQQR
jgi:hypothetical protein